MRAAQAAMQAPPSRCSMSYTSTTRTQASRRLAQSELHAHNTYKNKQHRCHAFSWSTCCHICLMQRRLLLMEKKCGTDDTFGARSPSHLFGIAAVMTLTRFSSSRAQWSGTPWRAREPCVLCLCGVSRQLPAPLRGVSCVWLSVLPQPLMCCGLHVRHVPAMPTGGQLRRPSRPEFPYPKGETSQKLSS